MSIQNHKEFYSDKVNLHELKNVMVCAKWVVHQLEDLKCVSLASVFQRAIDDAEAWIENMKIDGRIAKEYTNQPLSEEAETIRKILIKYASIRSPETRKIILQDMESLTKEKKH